MSNNRSRRIVLAVLCVGALATAIALYVSGFGARAPSAPAVALFEPVEEDIKGILPDFGAGVYPAPSRVGSQTISVVMLSDMALLALSAQADSVRVSVSTPGVALSALTLNSRRSADAKALDFSASRSQSAPADVALTLRGGLLTGTIIVGDTVLQVLPFADSASGKHLILRQPIPHRFVPEKPPQRRGSQRGVAADRPIGRRASAPLASAAPPTCAPTIVDVLVVFTAEAAEAYIDQDLTVAAQAGVLQTQQILTQSGVAHSIRLAGVRRMAPGTLPETGDLERDLEAVQASETIRAWRREVRADLVSVWVQPNAEWCGRGYLTTDLSDRELGYTVVPMNCALSWGQFSFAHEVGHNLGMSHDRENDANEGIYSFSRGYIAPTGTFRDVMAYACSERFCGRATLYSTPRVQRNGVAAGAVDQADNARTAASTVCRIGNWGT